MRRFFDLGVDGIITDRPDLAVRVRDEWCHGRSAMRDLAEGPAGCPGHDAPDPRRHPRGDGQRLRRMAPSPLLRHPLLAEALAADVHVKHENHNPTGAFKVRGGVNLIARLSDADRARGVISATTGNHGQSIAFAAARAGVPCTLVVPSGTTQGRTR